MPASPNLAPASSGLLDDLKALARTLFEVPSASVWLASEPSSGAVTDGLDRKLHRDGKPSLVIADLARDPEGEGPAADSPARFYAGVALRGLDGRAIGVFSIVDWSPRPAFTAADLAPLERLARLAEEIIAGQDAVARAREQAESLGRIEQMAGVGHWRLTVSDGAAHWSDEIYRIHGLTRDGFDPSRDDVMSFYRPDDGPRLRALVERAKAKGQGYSLKVRLIRADGAERRIQTQADVERDRDGRVVALFGIFQDITEQEELLERARRDESRYRLLAENVDDVITRVKPDGTSKYISPAIKHLLGWTLEEMSGQSTDYVHPEDRHLVLKAIGAAVKHGQATRLEHRAVHRDGTPVWVECTFKALRDDQNKVGDVVVVIRDVSRRKALEEEVIEARDRAEKAAAAKSEFLANMSHELRTPLTSVIGFSGLLQASTALPAEERRFVDRIATASEALLSVINDILDYSKLEAGRIDMDPQPFRPASLVESAATIVEPQCVEKGLTLNVRIDPAVPAILTGDEARLRQVLLNFLSNSAKFTARGGLTVTLGGAREADGRWRLRIAVTDTGIGIPPEKAEMLFQRFSQADASTTRVYGGTGLGLAISSRLIEVMDGKIGFDSRPGQGATFWIEVPLPEGEARDEDEGQSVAVADVAGRILVADDAPANRELLTTILRGLGLAVDAVNDGAEAVQALQDRTYDLVLMDVHMPVMDGFEATREIRRMQAGGDRRTPILALTANVQGEQVARCLEAGMDGHLGKPVQISTLAATLSTWLAQPTREELAS